MITRNRILKDSYHDSVFLMSIAARLKEMPGINEVSCVMGTDENLRIVDQIGLLTDEGRRARPNDLIVAVRAEAEDALHHAMQALEEALTRKRTARTGTRTHLPTLAAALREQPESNLALISLPGPYVRREAERALDAGLHVFIFSDNVSVEDEIALKTQAAARDLLVMGPDCGTSLIAGAAIGFANAVRPGRIGIIGAAGTGIQEVTTLIHKYGGGISHAIGTGGRDLSEAVGARTMLAGIDLLAADPDTDVVVLISKPASKEVADRVLEAATGAGKPHVVCFIGSPLRNEEHHVHYTETLADAAWKAVSLVGIDVPVEEDYTTNHQTEVIRSRMRSGARYLRALYSGGTLCYEAQILLQDLVHVHSNVPLAPEFRLADPHRSRGHTIVDLGEDAFTVGRPHPMIDFSLRNQRILQEVADPETAILLLDVVLGYGAHEDPAAELEKPLRAARDQNVPVVLSVCGTDLDPQGYVGQVRRLEELGAVVLNSNARAVQFVRNLLNQLPADKA